jgi:hypothetical protein
VPANDYGALAVELPRLQVEVDQRGDATRNDDVEPSRRQFCSKLIGRPDGNLQSEAYIAFGDLCEKMGNQDMHHPWKTP